MDAVKVQQIITELTNAGWTNQPVGYYKSGNQIKQITGFELVIRKTKIDDFLKKSSLGNSTNPSKIKGLGVGSTSPLGVPVSSLTPGQTVSLPALADFESYPSLIDARPDSPCILIGYDSEWENLQSGCRDMLSWQFAVVYDVYMIEICFIKTDTHNLSFDVALGCILDYLDVPSVDVRQIRRYMYCSKWDDVENKPILTITDNLNEARTMCKYAYRGRDGGEVGGWTHEDI